MYSIGDVVSVNDDRGEVSKMQKGHGDWVEDMTEVHMYFAWPRSLFIYSFAFKNCDNHSTFIMICHDVVYRVWVMWVRW